MIQPIGPLRFVIFGGILTTICLCVTLIFYNTQKILKLEVEISDLKYEFKKKDMNNVFIAEVSKNVIEYINTQH
jgi:hypothetical protein|tara:strand:+ start:2663 stop:2884 length:222 start_codon:yes stop_codon:yes gene_type:complete